MAKENSWGMHVEHWPQQELRHLPVFAKELLAGGVAGGLSKTCVAPLERVKILFQTGRMQGGIGETLASIFRSEGIMGWFRGNGASVLRIVPYAAFHFGAYEHYRKLFAKGVYGPDAELHHIPPWLDLLAGSAAGGTAVLMTYPLDLVRTRLAYDTESGARRPSNSGSSLAGGASSSNRARGQMLASLKGASRSFSSLSTNPLLQPSSTTSTKTTSEQPGSRHSARVSSVQSASDIRASTISRQPGNRHSTRVSLVQSAQDTSARAASGQSATSSGRPTLSRFCSTTHNPYIQGYRTHFAALGRQHCRTMALGAEILHPSSGLHGHKGVRGSMAALGAGVRGMSGAVGSLGPEPERRCVRRATIRSVLVDTVRKDGVLGLYRGIGPTLLGIVPYAGLKFYTYQSMKQQYWKLQEPAAKLPPEALQHHKLPVTTMLAFGAIAGVVTQTITYPLDVVRRHMQVQGLRKSDGQPELDRFKSTWHGLKSIVQQRGFRALYAGLSINYLKVVPSTAIGFTIYDAAKQYLDLPQNL